MHFDKHQHQNNLELYRRRMGFSIKHAGCLLGHKDGTALSLFERGKRLPSLINALQLSIILRVPVEFLYGELFDFLKTAIRDKEERLQQPIQQPLL